MVTSMKQLDLFPTWNKVQNMLDSWKWQDNNSSSYVIKDDVIKPAFKLLRQKDYICRMNFRCCGGCATYELHQMAEKRNKAGVVYWHNQDNARLASDRSVFLGYGSANEKELSSKDVGRHVVEALQYWIDKTQLPVNVVWDGNALNRIHITW